jgi:hypothetical protein
MNIEELLPVFIALVGSAGLWGFLSLKAKHSHERALKGETQSAEFNETLKEQVTRLDKKVDKLVLEKEELLNAIADLRSELAEARVNVQHLESIVRSRS